MILVVMAHPAFQGTATEEINMLDLEKEIQQLREEFNKLKNETVQRFIEHTDLQQKAISSRRGPEGGRGEKGEPGVSNIPGPRGLQGLKGDKGDRGEPGISHTPGPQGIKGESGERGPQGFTGQAGPKGDTGIQGPKGDPGYSPSISEIVTAVIQKIKMNL